MFMVAALAIFDLMYTTRILRLGGSELNKIMVWVMAAFGNSWSAVKYGVTMGAVASANDIALYGGVIVMGYVVYRNRNVYLSMLPR